MDLVSYLNQEQLTEQQFADLVGISQAAVNRYCNDRVPTPDVMARIIAATGGQVQPNDFYVKRGDLTHSAPTEAA